MTIILKHGDFKKVLVSIKPASVDLLLSDPPYGNFFKHTRKKFKGFVVNGDDLNFLPSLFEAAKIWFKPSAPVILFCDYKGFSRFEAQAQQQGFNLINVAVWDKQSWGIGYNFRPVHEFLMLFSQAKSVMALNRNLPSILRCPRVHNKQHPVQKPVALLKQLVENFCIEGGVVLDPCMGSGSTALACKQSGRSFIGAELEQQWYDLAKQRVKDNK